MTMIDGMATLIISSAGYPASHVTSALGIEPDWSAEKGELRPRSGDTGNEPIRRRVYEKSMWALEVDSNPGTKMAVDDDDAKGFASLHVLVDRLLGRGPALADLRQYYEIDLNWYGTAGAAHAGFVLPISLMRDLAEIGLDVVGTVYSHKSEANEAGGQETEAAPIAG